MEKVPNLIFGMHHLTVTQLPGGSFSHPNNAMDVAGQDNGVDFWFAKGTAYKCIAGPWGNGTFFFIPCDSKGNHIPVMCADGKQRKVTIALTHSARKYVKTTVGKVYDLNQPIYEEGMVGKATGNHIHVEVAEGMQTTKTYNQSLRVYTMKKELNPVKMFYILDGFTTVVTTKGATFKHTTRDCTSIGPELPKKLSGSYKSTLPFTQPSTNAIVNAHRFDFGVGTYDAYMKAVGGYSKYIQSLGGVFTKLADKNTKGSKIDWTARTLQELQECADYVWGLFTIYGVNYTDAKGKKVWGSSSGVYAADAFYNSRTNLAPFFKDGANRNGFKVSIDQILSGSTKGGMMTNCSWTVTYTLKKAGLIPPDAENVEVEFYGDKEYHKYYRNRGAKILTPKDSSGVRIGDVIGFFGAGSGFNYKHCCMVVDVDREKGTYTIFDGGSARFTKTRGCNVTGKLGDSPLYGSYKSFKVLRLKEVSDLLDLKYDKTKAGAYEITSDAFNIRAEASTGAKSLAKVPKGTLFTSDGYYQTDTKGRIWLYGSATSGKKRITGFACAKSYLRRKK